ncbi:MAG: hypothetical protein ABJA67_13210 [Chthonomonadales bacterium]
MTITIELTEAERIRLCNLAEKSGTDVEAVVYKLIGAEEPKDEKPKQTPKEFLDQMRSEGILDPNWGGPMNSQDLARKLRKELWGIGS